MPRPVIKPHPLYTDRILVGDCTYYLDDALLTAKAIYETVRFQMEKSRALEQAETEVNTLILEADQDNKNRRKRNRKPSEGETPC